MDALAKALKGCEGKGFECRKDAALPFLQVAAENQEKLGLACQGGAQACSPLDKERIAVVNAFQSGEIEGDLELNGDDRQLLLAFHMVNLQSGQVASEGVTQYQLRNIVQALGLSISEEKVLALSTLVSSMAYAMKGQKGGATSKQTATNTHANNKAPANANSTSAQTDDEAGTSTEKHVKTTVPASGSKVAEIEVQKLRDIGRNKREKKGLSPNGGIPKEGTPINNNTARKLIESRGTPTIFAREQVESFNGQIKATQGRKGDTFTITESSPGSGSGTYVTRESAGKTPVERVENLALPDTNIATYEGKVKLTRDQVLLEGKVASQEGNSQWFGNSPTGAKPKGGGEQVVTDNGFRSGAVSVEKESVPVPAFEPSKGTEALFATEKN